MKKIVSIFFLSVYLLSTTQVSELLKLPILVEHFEMHQQWDTKISFLDFLFEHYAESIANNADYKEDMKLPFKKASNCNHSICSFTPATPVIKMPKKEKFIDPVRRPLAGPFFYASAYRSHIWQPPKNC